MVFIEIGAIILFAGFVSAWTAWVYPNCRDGKEVSDKMLIYTQGECSFVMLPNERDRTRIDEMRMKKVMNGTEERLYWDGLTYVPKKDLKE